MPALESKSDTKYLHQLPTVSFRVIDDKTLEEPAGSKSVGWAAFPQDEANQTGAGEVLRLYAKQAHSNFRTPADRPDNDFSEFERPDYYIRYIGQLSYPV
jgi:hypothetical protein